MEICGHCHNVLSKTVERCTVCGTSRVDLDAADVRRREDRDQPSHAPGWAAPLVPDVGIHPDEFLRELTGDEAPSPRQADPVRPDTSPPTPPSPQRSVPAKPAAGALAGYLGTNVDRRPEAATADAPAAPPPPGNTPPPQPNDKAAQPEAVQFAQHLSTATHVAPDGVAARTTRLDGTVKLGPTPLHRVLTLGAPVVAALIVVAGIMGSYSVRTSQAEEVETASAAEALDVEAVSGSMSSVVRLDLDGCGIIDQTTGFLFTNNIVLVPQSEIVTDHRPSVVSSDGTAWTAEVQGWSLVRNLAVVRPNDRMPGGLEWGVSSRVRQGDAVSVLAITTPGTAEPVAATIAAANTINGRNVSFDLDISASEGSVVLNADGFVIGVFGTSNQALVSDDIAPAISRVVLDDARPTAECPAPPTTQPPPTTAPDALLPDAEETTTEDTTSDE